MPVNHMPNGSLSHWPSNVGILAVDIYFPNMFVDQTDLEKFNGVSDGKYTIGLGQNQMAFCTDREDINSICLTVTKSLLDKYSISPKDIGFLMIGTETIIDKSKSVKTVLMDLFAESGNQDIEGIHATNACYGGTDALFRAWDWIESSSWDGRYAIVVAADIAVYASGPARPTGGCGAIAMLIGPDAAVVFDRKVRSTYMAHVYDFYKPDLSSEYPTVDGPLSNMCYLQALDKCFQLYFEKANKYLQGTTLDSFDAIIFHAPYCKLVQKSIARLVLLNYLQSSENQCNDTYNQLERYKNIKLEDTYSDRELEKLLLTLSKPTFQKKTDPSLMLPRTIGNMYTASLYACLTSFLLSESLDSLKNKKLLLFSYGSGLAASMFSARISSDTSPNSALAKMLKVVSDIPDRLKSRHRVSAKVFEEALNLREKTHNSAPYQPIGQTDNLSTGTFFLTSVSDKYHRTYKRISSEEK
ncbi:hydroxymethylglutaryl-CoA synthase 1-like [Oppia nitens]|uniref:hydroxymethylglutaryl-CoA synthase 1-like n=1 Tax=Oppia nitens TaxID=1686743 RepID=UPI0023DADA47|nr:hydroxymethylglutaryl-CoA synthase 1-like [Oppia nitens]